MSAAVTILQRPIPSSRARRFRPWGSGTWRTFDVGASAAERAPLEAVLRRLVELGGRVVDSAAHVRRRRVRRRRPRRQASRSPTRLFPGHEGVDQRAATPASSSSSSHSRRLRTRRLDLMQIHNLLDWRTHLATLREWKEAGRIQVPGRHPLHGEWLRRARACCPSETLDFVQVNLLFGRGAMPSAASCPLAPRPPRRRAREPAPSPTARPVPAGPRPARCPLGRRARLRELGPVLPEVDPRRIRPSRA